MQMLLRLFLHIDNHVFGVIVNFQTENAVTQVCGHYRGYISYEYMPLSY